MRGFFRHNGDAWLMLTLMSMCLWTRVSCCLLAGADTGVCTEPADFDLLMPFCKTVVPYTACLPRYQSLWYNHSALTKDNFISQMFDKIVNQRKMYETNRTFLDKNTDEWGSKNEIEPRFVENPDCENAFKNYFCWLNFPRCDAEGRSLLLCRSVCENYMKACQMSKDLWRCGDPEYVNGRAPEQSVTWVNNELVYYRAPYPGSPFKDNAVDPDTNKPLLICTPSLENTATLVALTSSSLLARILSLVAVILLTSWEC
ncbi:hypothetical protein Poli38472_007922 [Pythium oligandrum]|uniref:FZ domain-containing protein n=1 Tax=Pythium oligandrum TaxID=41045 RepID=A0A8K1FIR6_PYTOL|nr:hypothetical protein Poli38472_007922 [Pythium oligandrum]|eukprot:TMW65280.1 hypothetical protein Poli38472_007922 [Pythium oligandrum]